MVLYWFLHNTVLQHCYAIVKHLYFHGFAPFVFSRVNFKKIIFPDDIGSTEFEIGANALAISDKTTKREFENAPRYMSLDVTYSTSRYSRNRDVRHYDMKVDSVRFCSDANIAKVKLRPQRRQRDV